MTARFHFGLKTANPAPQTTLSYGETRWLQNCIWWVAISSLSLFPHILHLNVETAHAQEYLYSPHEKPDPFDPTFATRIQDVTDDPLLKNKLTDMSLAAIFIGTNNGAYALVEVPEGSGEKMRTHRLRVGDKLGPKSGHIIAILRDRIVIREPLETPREGAFSRFQDTAMMLRQADPDSFDTDDGNADPVRDISLDGNAAPKPLEDALTADVLPQEQNTYSPYRPRTPKKIEKYRSDEPGSGAQTQDNTRPNARTAPQTVTPPPFQTGTGITVTPIQPSPFSLQQGGNPYGPAENEVNNGFRSF
jgi:Tfp pilus assembly protein PilP